MKKYIKSIAALFAALTVITSAAFAAVNVFDVPENISVNDYSVVMQTGTKTYIRQCNNTLMDSVGAKVIFVTVPTTGGESIDSYAKRLRSAWGVSSIGNDSSTFVLLATEDMEYWAIVGDHIKSALTDETVDEIMLKYTEPDFSQRNFDAAIEKTFDAISSWYTTAYGLTPFSRNTVANTASADNTDNAANAKALWHTVRTVLITAAALVVLFFVVRRCLRLYVLSQRRKQRVTEYKRRLRRDLSKK